VGFLTTSNRAREISRRHTWRSERNRDPTFSSCGHRQDVSIATHFPSRLCLGAHSWEPPGPGAKFESHRVRLTHKPRGTRARQAGTFDFLGSTLPPRNEQKREHTFGSGRGGKALAGQGDDRWMITRPVAEQGLYLKQVINCSPSVPRFGGAPPAPSAAAKVSSIELGIEIGLFDRRCSSP
jgi:hypothetical protein